MVSGPDIITYIGVPLAVLGVLPIIYNTIATLVTLANVRRILRHGRLAVIARGDVINHVIEVELPRYTIAPLHRAEQTKEYWGLCDYPSRIPGGSWTIFNWKAHAIGLKTQRLDYSDQLRQPQAEISFEELVSFLLDLGAVPDGTGWRMLRGSGLWVPVGTPLLLSPDGREAVLTIAPLDDSDGNLSLAVRWSSSWGMRDHTSLPPYWVLIKGQVLPTPSKSYSEKDAISSTGEVSNGTGFQKPLQTQYQPTAEDAPPAIRCQIRTNGLVEAVPDDFDAQMFDGLDIAHLEIDEGATNTIGIWFASAITAFGTSSQTILWNYKIPPDIIAFAKKDTIPCGILVLLGVVEESTTPEWATQYKDDEEVMIEALHRKRQEQARAMMREQQLSPEERTRAFHERTRREHEDWISGLNATRRRDAQRAEMRVSEAVQSPKWGNKLVAEHQLAWLKAEGYLEESIGVRRAVEILLLRMINERQLASDLANVLDSWRAFVDNGGMRKAEFLDLKEKQLMFAYASLILSAIEDSVTAVHGSFAMDLQECLRIWKKVRLG